MNILKNTLNYFYNIEVDDIRQNDKIFYFDYAGYRYGLVPYKGEVNLLPEIYNLHIQALSQGINVHQIITNKDGNIATLVNGTPYILMRIYYDKEKVDLDKIMSFSFTYYDENSSLIRTDWEKLWSDKIDYLEYEISQVGVKHPEIRDSFSYFVGLGETSIGLVNMIMQGKEPMIKTISHDRIRSNDTLFDLYNPLNLVIDYRVRDVAEYLKYKYFSGENIDNDINYFFKYGNLSLNEYLLFLARMIYPTYYFDIYEEIISGKDRTQSLKKIITKVDDYELLLKKIYAYYKNHFQVFRIEWLEF